MAKPLTIDQLRSLINSGNASDPLVFLESVMNGQDPRRLSKVYQLASDIEDFSEGQPTEYEWGELFQAIRDICKFNTVSLSESTAAAKTVAEYLHAKRKNVSIHTDDIGNSKVTLLEDDEIRRFLNIYEDEF